jgi:DNA-binding transcriptional regulator GbsR (MarR family)
MRKKNDHAMSKLSKEVGQFIEYWGFKRIHGEVWTHLYLSSFPLSAAQLTEKLKVSKALLSLCMRDLLKYKLISRIPDKNKKTKLFVANPDVFAVIRHVLEVREKKMLERIKTATAAVQSVGLQDPALSTERTQKLLEMTTVAQTILEQVLPLEPFVVAEITKDWNQNQ